MPRRQIAEQTRIIERVDSNIHVVRFPNIVAGWEQWILLRSDAHHDNAHCQHKYELEHLEKARERNALILDAGDLFCAMQGKYDPRSEQSALRPEHRGSNYLDKIVDTATDFYKPYADLFLLLGYGNHETKIKDRCGTDLTARLANNLGCQVGGYGGWVRFRFTYAHTQRESRILHYFHGAGGGGPVTKGVLSASRQAMYLSNVDYVLNGHVHEANYFPITQLRLSEQNVIQRRTQHHIRTPGYKDEYGTGQGGWHVETGKPPKPLGAAWIHFSFYNCRLHEKVYIDLI